MAISKPILTVKSLFSTHSSINFPRQELNRSRLA